MSDKFDAWTKAGLPIRVMDFREALYGAIGEAREQDALADRALADKVMMHVQKRLLYDAKKSLDECQLSVEDGISTLHIMAALSTLEVPFSTAKDGTVAAALGVFYEDLKKALEAQGR